MDKSRLFIIWGTHIVELITALLAILCWKKRKSIPWRIFIFIWVLYFLLYTTQYLLFIRSKPVLSRWLPSYLTYEFDLGIFYPGVTLLYSEIFSKSWLRWFAIFTSVAFVVWGIIILPRENSPWPGSYSVGVQIANSVIVFFALVYLVKSWLDKKTTTPLYDDFYYWFSAGFFIYFTYLIILTYIRLEVPVTTGHSHSEILEGAYLFSPALHLCLWGGFRAALKWMK